MKNKVVLALAVGVVLTTLPLAAHHSFAAEYDGNKPVTLRGKVTKLDWVNPHSWVYMDVTDATGKVVNWSCEIAPPNALYRMGWRKDSLKPGDDVTIDGFLAKDGTPTMNARSVTMADGRKMFAGSSGDGGPQSKTDSK